MPGNLEKFRDLLKELFQLDQADLDFGIYRIMNARRDEILRFLDKDLLPQVKDAFADYQLSEKAALQAELDAAIKKSHELGTDPESAPAVKQLREKLAGSASDLAAIEDTVFSHLFNFFRRYYDSGDFISQRRYKEGVYAIPYEGEEVKLYWANHEQYYIKSSETFRDYTFKLDSGKRVNFRIIAAGTEQDNNKLDRWFEKQKCNTREKEYDIYYVNGDNNLENLRREDQTWKVRLIEEEFQRLMFEVGES